MFTRRHFLQGFATVSATALVAQSLLTAASAETTADGTFEVVHTEEEWRALLTPQQFAVLRKQDTEPPFTSPLNKNHVHGTYACAACDLPLFSSETKFDSGTGWPSFWAPIENAIGTETDNSWIVERTEVHCRRCGGHQGHVFADGPPPTGLRYCINGVALKFIPA